MKTITKMLLFSALMLWVTPPVFAQNPQDGDYYTPNPTEAQRASSAERRLLREGDFYPPGQSTPQQVSSEEQRIQQGGLLSSAIGEVMNPRLSGARQLSTQLIASDYSFCFWTPLTCCIMEFTRGPRC
jgi:hypothetical protein